MRMLLVGNAPQFRSFTVGDVLRFEYTSGDGHVLKVTTATGEEVQFVDSWRRVDRHYKLSGHDILTGAIANLIANAAGMSAEHKDCNSDDRWYEYTLCPIPPNG